MTTGALTEAEIAATAAYIASVQLPTGMIPWAPGGHADPWNHTEAAMALVAGGRREEAEAAYGWLAEQQLADGSWCLYYLAEGVEEPRRDPNVCAYVAAGVWWHWLETGDERFVRRMWPVVERAVDFVVGVQRPDGSFAWSLDVDGTVGGFALLTGSSSIHHSLRCAVAVAQHLGLERPEWELAVGRVRHAVAHRPEAFAPKDRWAMDWYYPVLSGAVDGDAARERLLAGWSRHVSPGIGVRCVADHEWITTAETAECAMALHTVGLAAEARTLLDTTRHFRLDDGSYWTGCVHPQCVRYPGGERATYGAAAVVMAEHALSGHGGASVLFGPEPGLLSLDMDDEVDTTSS